MKIPSDVFEKMGHYVYRLIDPRDGATFYVGRGVKDRVLQHVKEALVYEEDQDEESEKIKTIRQIHAANLEPIHIIHRHGLTLDEAKIVEAALIDYTPGLTNIQGGEGSGQFGPANLKQLVELYQTETLELLPGDLAIAISVNKSVDERSMYDAVRAAWRIDVKRAKRANLVFATVNGVCKAVITPDPESWLPATKENFPFLHQDIEGRFGFSGEMSKPEVQQRYKGKKLPDNMQRKRGASNPVLYSYD
jgi:hypothetical protein